MKKKIAAVLDGIIYWSIVLLPFSIAVAPAAMEVCAGLLSVSFLAKKSIGNKVFALDKKIAVPCLLLLVISVFSMLNSVNHHDSMRGLFKLVRYLLLLAIMAEEVKDRRHIGRIVVSMVAGAFLVSVDAVWQLAVGKDFIRGNAPVVNIGIARATASFPDANVLGIYLSALVLVPLAIALYHARKAKRVLIGLVTAVIISGLALTYSRPTLLAVYVSTLILGVVRRGKALILILLFLAVIAPFAAPASVKDFARQVNYDPLRFMCNDDRIAIYRNTVRMIQQHPVIGVGVNTFMKNYRFYKESPEYRNVVTSDFIYAHNNFLHMAGETGLLGLGIFCWFLIVLFRENLAGQGRLRDRYLALLSLAVVLCLVAFLINGLTESSLYYSKVAMIFWYLAGLSLAFKQFVHEDTGKLG